MRLSDVIKILDLETVIPGDKDMKIACACGADLMSDVLAFSQDKTLLLTGLTNPQVVRTAEMIDINVIIFVRGKKPPEDTVKLAKKVGISLYLAEMPLFECCGKLYEEGLKPEKIDKFEMGD